MTAEKPLGGVREFLERETLAHFISEHHKVLTILSSNASIGDAMKLLSQRRIMSMPVVDDNGEYRGAVSAPDVLRGLMRNLDANLGENYLQYLSTIPAEEITKIGKFYASKPVTHVLHDADLWMKGDQSTTLMTVLKEGYHIEHSRVHHRIYVCDPAKSSHKLVGGPGATVVNIAPGSEAEGGSSWIPTNVVSQHDMVSLLEREGVLADIQDSVEQLGLGKTVVSTVSAEQPALLALHNMAIDHKSAVGVTDADGKLVGSLSVGDLVDLPVDNFGLLMLPISKALKQVFTNSRLDLVPATMSFVDLVKKVISERLHRVYVLSEDGKPRSIVTLTDVLRVVSGASIPKD